MHSLDKWQKVSLGGLLATVLGAMVVTGVSMSKPRDSAARTHPVAVTLLGAVRKPDTLQLDPQTTVGQALAKGGGTLSGADVSSIDLTAKVENGMVIFIAGPDDGRPSEIIGGKPAAPVSFASVAQTAPAGPISLSTATREELISLPQVGPSLADRILQYRQQSGGFRSVDELDNVKGIGPKTLEKIRPYVRP